MKACPSVPIEWITPEARGGEDCRIIDSLLGVTPTTEQY